MATHAPNLRSKRTTTSVQSPRGHVTPLRLKTRKRKREKAIGGRRQPHLAEEAADNLRKAARIMLKRSET